MSVRRMALNVAANTLLTGIRLLAPRTRALVSAHLAERLEPVVTIKTTFGLLIVGAQVALLYGAQCILDKRAGSNRLDWSF